MNMNGMKWVYIVYPFQEKEENRKKIDQICRAVARMGYLPVSPVHTFSFSNNDILEERHQVLNLRQELVKVCDQAWLFGDWRQSEECRLEVRAAQGAGILLLDFEVVLTNFDKISKLKELIKCCG